MAGRKPRQRDGDYRDDIKFLISLSQAVEKDMKLSSDTRKDLLEKINILLTALSAPIPV